MVWKRGCCSSQCYSLKTNSQSSGWASRHSRSSSGTLLPRSNWSQARAPTGNLLLINPFPSPSAETSDPICRKKKNCREKPSRTQHLSLHLLSLLCWSCKPMRLNERKSSGNRVLFFRLRHSKQPNLTETTTWSLRLPLQALAQCGKTTMREQRRGVTTSDSFKNNNNNKKKSSCKLPQRINSKK